MNPDSQQPVASAPQPGVPAPTPNPGFTPAQPPASMGSGPVAMGGKKFNMNIVIGIIVAVVLIAGGVAYGVYAYVSNLPDNMLKSAVSNLRDAKALGGTFKVLSGTSANGITVSGDFGVNTDPSNAKNAELLLGLGTGSSRVGITALSLDGTAYLKLSNMENLGAFMSSIASGSSSFDTPEVAAALKNVNDQWFELTQNDVKSIAQSSGNDSVSGAVSAADLKQVLGIYDQHQFIKTDKTYPDEVVDGSNSAHFSLKSDKTQTVAFLQAIKDANLSTIQVSDADIADAKAAPDTSTTTLEIWVARDTKQFKQVRIVSTEKGSEFTLTLTLTSKLPTFDKFEKPASTRTLSDFTTLLLGSSAPAL